MNEKTKVVVVQERRYQIRRMRPDVGSFILSRILAAGMGAGAGLQNDKPDKPLIQAMLAAFLNRLDFDTFSFIQNRALAVVSRLDDDGAPLPLVADNGVFADQELATSISLAMALTVQSLVFNLSDFFSEGGLNSLLPH